MLIDTPEGDALRLWDTPGFGDSARLLRRLRASDNPIGWLLTQVWDRFTDRPFFSSQQAIRNVRDESDVVLYLVNAAEDPARRRIRGAWRCRSSAGSASRSCCCSTRWAPRAGAGRRGRGGTAWRQHLASHPGVRGVIGLDAFARCWVQEDKLLGAVGGVLPADKQQAFERLRARVAARNLGVFDAAMQALAAQLAAAATDRETVSSAQRPAKGRPLAGVDR